MKLIKITPRGFCAGVVFSWKILLDTQKKYPEQNIYMLGWFVHNNNFVQKMLEKGFLLLDDTNCSRYDLIKNTKFKSNDVIVLSAHGTEQKTIDLIKQKNLICVDTTCSFVKKTQNLIKQELINKNNIVVYIGKKNHPETNSCICISNKIKLVCSINDFNDIDIDWMNKNNKTIVVFNQTTLSIYELNNFFDFIKKNFKNYKFYNELCTATIQRQEAILKYKDQLDFLIVIGDKKSNNANSLIKISNSLNLKCILINSINELDINKLNQYKKIGITSSASTPTWLTNEIIEFIQKNCNCEIE